MNMTFETFSAIILIIKNQSEKLSGLNSLGVDLVNFVDPYNDIISRCIKEFYGDDGLDWFDWFCYESDFGQRDWSKAATYVKNDDGTSTKIHEAGEPRWGATDKEGNPICHSILSTWEYLENNHKIK
jgi:hypothetical protein